MSLTAFITRAGVTPPEYLGHIVRIPAVPTPDALREAGLEPAKLDGLEDALFADRLAGLGKPGRLIPYGLVEPTPWERRFVAWVARRLGLTPEVGWDTLRAKAALPALEPVAAALADPLATPPTAAPVDLVAGDDPELEALGAVRAIRRWLEPQPLVAWPAALEDVVVLLPASASRRALWRETLSRHGLPAEATESIPLAQTTLGLWLLTLARLAGWSDKVPATREDLRLALLAPYVSLPEGARRLDVRECLRGLRTWAVGLSDWCLHFEGYFAAKREELEGEEDLSAEDRRAALAELRARQDGFTALTDALVSNLAHADERLFPGLLKLLETLRVQARVQASKVEPAIWALDRATRVVQRLAHDPDPTRPAAGRLQAALAEQAIRADETPRHGIRITTYAQFDGRPARLLVLAGLEEGGWPAAPARRSREEAKLATALGLLSPADELARQSRVASAAARTAGERLVLSWSRADEAGSQTFAGPLLAAVRATPSRPGLPEQLITEAEAVPHQVSELTTPAEVLQAPWPAVGKALDGATLEAWTRGEAAAAHLTALESARDPEVPTPVGPYTGQVGVSLLGSNRFSPTSLETMGQCAMKYFLGKVLKVESKDDAGVDLDAAEVGSLLHEAFSSCAQEAIAKSGAWQLSGVDEAKRAAHVEKLAGRLDKAVDKAVEALAAREPTLARALVDRLADRWKRALRGWAAAEAAAPEGGVFEAGASLDPLALKPKQLEVLDDKAREVVEKCRNSGLDKGRALLAKARKTAAKTAAEAKRWYDEASQDGDIPVGKGKFADAARLEDAKARAKALDLLEADAEATLQKHLLAAKEALAKVYGPDRLAVPRRVVTSEWGFGDQVAEDADPASTEKPLVLTLPGDRTIELRGRVDRLDGAEDRPDLAVVDYKTGKAKSANDVRAELGEGRHLQLPVYALAAEALRAGKGGISKKAKVVAGRLHFPRSAKEAPLPLEPGLGAPFVEEGKAKEHEAGEVLLAHLGHTSSRLEAGTLPVVPRACPLESTGYCDFAAICDYRPAAKDLLEDPDPQPRFVNPPKPPGTPKVEELPPPTYAPAQPVSEPPLAEAGEKVHAEGRRLASDLEQDVTLSAGAGSGKTTALVDRHTGALAAGCEPDEILCVTFTRKATAEMRSRVRARLLEQTSATKEQRRRWIAGLSCAPIHTIDALAAVIVNEYADEPVEVVDGVSDAAAEFVAERLADEAGRKKGDLDRLFTDWPPAKVRTALEGLLQQDRALEETAKLDAAGVLAGWEAEAERRAPGVEKATNKWLKQVSAALDEFEDGDKPFLADLQGKLADVSAAFEAHGVLVGLYGLNRLRFSRHKPSEEAVALREQVRAWLGHASGWFGGAADALAYSLEKGDPAWAKPVRRQLEQEATTSASALAVARGWLEAFLAFRQKRRLVTFPEVIERATRTIAEVDPADLAARFPFKHVLVDEFQDTDGSQIHFIDTLVAALRRGRPKAPARLFVVGDPKQSIYRFRGAEVDLFEERTSQPGAGHGQLTTCFRAEPPLTRAVDRLFERLFDGKDPTGAPLDPEAAVPWQPLSPKADGGTSPCIELLRTPPVPPSAAQPGDEVEKEPSETAEAEEEPMVERPIEQALVRRIRVLLAEASTRPVQEGEAPVAVLTHSWARAAHYGQLLRDHGIPAYVQGGRGLLETREVRDLFHWLVALERQDDSAAFAGVLRGATIGLSDPGLYCLRRGFGLELWEFGDDQDAFRPADASTALSRLSRGFRFDAKAALKAMQAARGKKLAPAVAEAIARDAERLEVFQRAWQEASRAFGLTNTVEVLDGILAATAYEAALRARPDGLQALGNLRVFRALVREAQAGATPSEVVRSIRELAEAGEDPAAAGLNLAPGAAVLLTTIHQSKGREWDVVVVPDLEKVTVKSRVSGVSLMRLVRKTPKGWKRSWLPGSMLEDWSDLFSTYAGAGSSVLVEATRGAERAESRRLMYVAFTRARRKLVISADWPDETRLGKWTKEAGELALPDSKEWRRDLVYALQCQVGPDGGLVPGDVWKEGRDFVWVTPPGEGYGEAPAAAPVAAKADPARIRLAAQAVAMEPLQVMTPSGLPPAPAHPPATLIRAMGKGPGTASPFGSADEEGTAFHRTAQLWSYAGPCDRALIERAVRGEYGDYKLGERVDRIEAMLRWIENSHPTLVAELKDAAARGDLFHEVAVGHLRQDGAWVEALVDLLFRDRAGAWHVLDYKTNRIPDEATLKTRLADYHAQVAAYAEALGGRLPGGARVASYGLWFVTAGVVGRWDNRLSSAS